MRLGVLVCLTGLIMNSVWGADHAEQVVSSMVSPEDQNEVSSNSSIVMNQDQIDELLDPDSPPSFYAICRYVRESDKNRIQFKNTLKRVKDFQEKASAALSKDQQQYAKKENSKDSKTVSSVGLSALTAALVLNSGKGDYGKIFFAALSAGGTSYSIEKVRKTSEELKKDGLAIDTAKKRVQKINDKIKLLDSFLARLNQSKDSCEKIIKDLSK